MLKIGKLTLALVLGFTQMSCGQTPKPDSKKVFAGKASPQSPKMENKLDTVTFGSGCFWCTEAIFLQLEGVESAISGYSGGQTKNPTYKEICTGQTGHAEVVQVVFNPSKISFSELLEAFWSSHDPTTLNRQGADVGTQYRSVIYYHNEEQKKLSEAFKTQLNTENAFGKPVVTEISPIDTFYIAEDYHQDYYALNGNAPYCRAVIAPKLDKFRKVFADKLKEQPTE